MKGRKGKGTGGVNEAEDDIKDKPKDRTEPSKPAEAAEELKKGGRAKKATGGAAVPKLIGRAEGGRTTARADRMPRKSGGRTGSDSSPLTSAHSGKNPPGRSLMAESLD
jgi:hypothetical protein